MNQKTERSNVAALFKKVNFKIKYMTEDIMGQLAFAIAWTVGILIIVIGYFIYKPKNHGMDNMPSPPPKGNTDSLRLLREDTYTNEETDEMTGRMHREQYRKENN